MIVPTLPSTDDVRIVDLGGTDTARLPAEDPRRADVPGNTSSNVELALDTTYYGSLEAVGDHDWLRMDLAAGEYQVRVHGVGTNELNDPLVALRGANGEFLGEVDDYEVGWGGANSQDPYVIVTISVGGTFFLDVSSFVEGSTADDTGDYIVTMVEGGNGTPLTHTLDEIAWQLTNNAWEDPDGGNLPGAIAFDVGGDGKLTYNIAALTRDGRDLAEAALAVWSDVTGIEFEAKTGAAELTFDDSDEGTTAYAGPVQLNGSTIQASSIMITTGWLNQFGTDFASYSYETYIHEIGHALGLGHGGNYDGTIEDNYYTNDSLVYSIMSYSQVDDDHLNPGQPGNNPTIDASFSAMQTVAIADVIAIQNLYGDDTSTRTGNTRYGFNANTGNDALDQATDLGRDMFFLVYDDGGKDTLNFSETKAVQRIDLNSEGYSNVLGGEKNVWIARGIRIENATGGDGRDTMFGNTGNNIIIGGAGSDSLDGDAGNDKLTGGAGNDGIDTGAGRDVVISQRNSNLDRVNDFDDGADRLDLRTYDFDNFNQVKALAEQDGRTLVIDLPTTSVIELFRMTLARFDAADVLL